MHLVAKFHEQGILAEVLNRKSDLNQINQQTIQREKAEQKDVIVDIYNYAARFDTVPKIVRRKVKRKERGREKSMLEVTVELFEQGIQVTGRAVNPVDAEVNAGMLFKKEAEKYHAERGSEAIIIKDSGALTADNASKFLEFYKILRPGIKIESEADQVLLGFSSSKQNWNKVQIKINGEPVGQPVELKLKNKAEEVAQLTASIALKIKEPDLYPRFIRALRSGNGQILKPVSPIDFVIDEDCSLVMRETLLGARKAGLPDDVEELGSEVSDTIESRSSFRRQLSEVEIERKNWFLKQRLNHYLQNEKLTDLRNKRAELPMNQYSAKVLDMVNNNIYSIIVGATGSGKTTQVPQILLEQAIKNDKGAECNIICTQPRRIAAVSVARRVADERAEGLKEHVGYHVRFDAKVPPVGGSVTYCTTGILLQQLQHSPDEIMDSTSHLVIDEVHERDMQIDFLLILLKKGVARRIIQGKKVPRIVLMSATLDTELFASYFGSDVAGSGQTACPTLSVPGRTFPVKERYLEEIVKEMNATSPPAELQAMHLDRDSKDYLGVEDKFRLDNPTSNQQQASNTSSAEGAVIDWRRERALPAEDGADGAVSAVTEKENGLIPYGLIACTIAHIAKTSQEGAILVFLPGLAEITKVHESLTQHKFGVDFKDESKFNIIMLHSSIAASQNTVFEPVPQGCRKIILATNIAETSVTIPDVQYVVDTGKLREKQYDQTRRISQLACSWISKSNAKQRAGRAGRVQNGNYYALYTQQRYNSLRAIGLPELLRVDLQEICLNIKAQAFKTPIREFLAEAIEPPSPKSVDASVVNLEALDALTDEEEITPLGRLLSSLPVHPSLGKMIVLGIIFRCLDPMLVLGAASSERNLFLQPLENRAAAQEAKLAFVEGSASDHMAILNAVRELRRLRDKQGEGALRQFAHRNFLHINAFKTIDQTAQQISDVLVDAGLIPKTRSYERVNSQYGDASLNENSHKVPLIKALAVAGFHPNLAVNCGGRAFRTLGEKATMVHPSSVNAIKEKSGRREGRQDAPLPRFGQLFTYTTMARSNDGNTIFLRETTESTPLAATLFGGKIKRNEERGNILELDSWLPFYVSSFDRRAAKTIIEFRKALERLLTTAFKDLGRLSVNHKIGGGVDKFGNRNYLADKKVIQLFASGLVEALDRDVKIAEPTARRGWGNTRGSGSTERSGESTRSRQGSRAAATSTGGRGEKWGMKTKGERTAGFYGDMMRA